MFCPKCGTQNLESGRFCRNCGADLGNVSDALSGNLQNRQLPQRIYDRKGKPISWESAVGKIFSGLAFLIVAIVLAVTGAAGGKAWWFWLLIPAFGALGSGIAQFLQIKSSQKNNVAFAPGNQNQFPNAPPSKNLPPSQQDLTVLQNLIDSGNKIQAIKFYRELYGVGLKEAKDAVEQGELQPVYQPANYSAAPLLPSMTDVQNLLNAGRKIEAIKIYREIYNVGLKEAKDAVDNLEAQQTYQSNDYREPPRSSIYDTGELTPPPSVTENTTKHLQIDNEGETMTLPKSNL